MATFEVFYMGESYGEATLCAAWPVKAACDLLEQSGVDVNPAFVQAVEV